MEMLQVTNVLEHNNVKFSFSVFIAHIKFCSIMHLVVFKVQLLLLVDSDGSCLAESLVTLMLVMHEFQTVSNCAGVPQYWGNRLNMVCLSCISSFMGSPGCSLCPYTVQRARTSSPKKLSLASFTAKAPTLPIVFRVLYVSTTVSTGKSFVDGNWFQCWTLCLIHWRWKYWSSHGSHWRRGLPESARRWKEAEVVHVQVDAKAGETEGSWQLWRNVQLHLRHSW